MNLLQNEFFIVLILALFPAIGNMAGGLAAEWMAPSKKLLNRALHAAAGIMLAIVSIEVMPEAMKHVSPWLIALMFVVGGCAYILVDIAVKSWSGSAAGAWMVYVAVVADLIGDGLLIGTGAAVSIQLALILALGQVLADVPEGFAVIVNFRDKGMSRFYRLLVTASFLIPVVVSAFGAYFLLRGQSRMLQITGLVFVAGMYCLAAVEDILREAHETSEDSQWSAISFLVGFVIVILLSGYFD